MAIFSSILRFLMKLNLLMGVLIAVMLIASLVAETWVMRALGVVRPGHSATLFFGMRLIMVIGLCTVPVVQFISQQLLMIIATVRTGDPFIAANAARLRAIAWALLAEDLMHLIVGAVGSRITAAGVPLHLSWGFSLTRCFAVLLFFVIARVFDQGARMREDLEGTV